MIKMFAGILISGLFVVLMLMLLRVLASTCTTLNSRTGNETCISTGIRTGSSISIRISIGNSSNMNCCISPNISVDINTNIGIS